MRLPRRSRSRPRHVAGLAWVVAVAMLAEVLVVSGAFDSAAGAWFGACRGKPTATQASENGIDLKMSTHQWFAAQAITVLRAEGHDAVVKFLETPDPKAPPAAWTKGASPGATEPYAWRLVKGASDADCELYSQVPDHLHNFWSHRGRRMVVGGSAASNAEKSFDKAVKAWQAGDRSSSMQWLGASLHLVQDSCVPQHNFFGISVNHNPYERWVRTHQDQLAVTDGPAVTAADFRQTGGHGGAQWSSAHPRGWADECAHRAAGVLRAASADPPKPSTPNDPQWKTVDHLSFSQRLGAGYLLFFFDKVGLR